MSATLSACTLLAVPLAPLAGAALAGIFGTTFGGNKLGRTVCHSLTILGVFVSFLISCYVLSQVLDGARFNQTVYEWMVLGSLKMEVGFMVDGLTAMMMMVVTFVSLMVHIYTIGYMHEDAGYNRFFAYISLFTFSMLMLVMSNNMLQLFFGWEAVGLVSYLLIGFWFNKLRFHLGHWFAGGFRWHTELHRVVRQIRRVGQAELAWHQLDAAVGCLHLLVHRCDG
jgi:NADH-quinone oxidoreductase subunit L